MCVIKDCGAGDPRLTSSLLEEGDLHKPGSKNSHTRKQLPSPDAIPLKVHQSHPSTGQENTGVPEEKGTGVLRLEGTAGEGNVLDAGVQTLENTTRECVLPDILGRKMTAGSVIALGALDKPQDR